ncbi:MAG: hydrogenase maturation protease [Halococcoides sp.]
MTGDTLVLGLGNPTRGDDRVGHAIVSGLRVPPGVDRRVTILSDVRLVDLLAGYDRAIVVDAVPVEADAVGQWWHQDAASIAAHEDDTDFSHELSLGRLLELARHDARPAPTVEAVLVGIAADDRPQVELSETLSPAVRAAVDPVRAAIRTALDERREECSAPRERDRTIAGGHTGDYS